MVCNLVLIVSPVLKKKNQIKLNVSDSKEKAVELPRYSIVFDHDYKSLVLAIRGTLSPSDVLTDLQCSNVPFLNGLCGVLVDVLIIV